MRQTLQCACVVSILFFLVACGGGKSPEPSAPAVAVQAAPTGLKATASDGQITLTWTAAANASSYSVYLGTSSNGEPAAATVAGIIGTSYLVTGLKNGTTYFLKMTAEGASASSVLSAEVSARPNAPPGAPQSVSVTAGDRQVALAWVAPTGSVSSYAVFVSTASGSMPPSATLTGITGQSATVTGLSNGAIYYFSIVAYMDNLSGPPSAEAASVPAAAPVAQGTLLSGVIVLTDIEIAQIVSETPTQVIFNGTIALSTGQVFLTANGAYLVDSATATGSQTLVSVHVPQIEEVFSSLKISGTYPVTSDTQIASAASPIKQTRAKMARLVDPKGTSGSLTQTFPIDFSSGGFSASGSMTAILACDLDYDFSSGVLQSGRVTVSQSDQLAITSLFKAGASGEQDFALHTFVIPIPVSVVDAFLNAAGVRIASLQIPVSVLLKGAVKFTSSATLKASSTASATVKYAAGATPTTSSLAGTSVMSVDPSSIDTAGSPVLADLTATGGIYLHLRPALAFLNQVALLGADLRGGPTGKLDVQVTADSPPYCLAVSYSLDAAASGFFKTVGVSKTSGEVNMSKDFPPPIYSGSCKLQATIAASIAAASGTVTYLNSAIISVSAKAMDSAVAGTKAPTGSITVTMDGESCTAPLQADGSGTCSLYASPAGSNSPYTLSYSGDANFGPAEASFATDVSQTATSLTVAVPTSVNVGDAVHFAIQVAPPDTLAAAHGDYPTGDVYVVSNTGRTLCIANLDNSLNGTGDCSAAFAEAGSVTVTANYGGDPNYLGSYGSGQITVQDAPPNSTVLRVYKFQQASLDGIHIPPPGVVVDTPVTVPVTGTSISAGCVPNLQPPCTSTTTPLDDSPGFIKVVNVGTNNTVIVNTVTYNPSICKVGNQWIARPSYSWNVLENDGLAGISPNCSGPGTVRQRGGTFNLDSSGNLAISYEEHDTNNRVCPTPAGPSYTDTVDSDQKYSQTYSINLSTGQGSYSESTVNHNGDHILEPPPATVNYSSTQDLTSSGSNTWPSGTTTSGVGLYVSRTIPSTDPVPAECTSP